MDPPVDNEEALRDDGNEDANAEAAIPSRLYSFAARFRNIGVRAIFQAVESGLYSGPTAVLVLYLLHPDLRQEIAQELRAWIVHSGCFRMSRITDMFDSLGRIDVEEQIEQEHAEAWLEFVDMLGPLVVEARLASQNESLDLELEWMNLLLGAPLGAILASKFLQYVGSVVSIKSITLSCHQQHRAFRADEVEQLVNVILHQKQLHRLEIDVDMTGVLLVDLCARLKDLKNLSIRSDNGGVRHELPNEAQLIRNIQQISSLEILHLCSATLGESTVDLFSPSEVAYTKLVVEKCHFIIGDDDGGNVPSELPLAVALASNTRLEELSLRNVQGSGAFYDGIEHGLLNNRTLRTLVVSNYDVRANLLIPEIGYCRWMQSIRFHPALRRLVIDTTAWCSRVADALCSVIRENTSLHSMELVRNFLNEESDNDFDPEWIGAVRQALQANRTIVDVRIEARSTFGDQNWNRLADLLNVNDSIENINHDAGDDSIPERLIGLMQRVKSNRTLRRLGLNNAKFRRHHTSDLVELLSDNFVLESLAFAFQGEIELGLGREHDPISCSDEGSQRLLRGILDLNYDGRKYMKTEPNSVDHGVALLSQVSSNLDAVYFHLRENPRLCDRRELK